LNVTIVSVVVKVYKPLTDQSLN